MLHFSLIQHLTLKYERSSDENHKEENMPMSPEAYLPECTNQHEPANQLWDVL